MRPLPFTNKNDAPSITRRHFIRRHPQLDKLFSIVGGKLTTYRSLAEEAVDLLFRELGRSSPSGMPRRQALLPGATADFETFSDDFQSTTSRLSEASRESFVASLRSPGDSLVMDLVAEDLVTRAKFSTRKPERLPPKWFLRLSRSLHSRSRIACCDARWLV